MSSYRGTFALQTARNIDCYDYRIDFLSSKYNNNII